MLEHKFIGPDTAGAYSVVYPTPGCDALTVACVCRTEAQAQDEAYRRNNDQLARERILQADRLARGLVGAYPALDALHP